MTLNPDVLTAIAAGAGLGLALAAYVVVLDAHDRLRRMEDALLKMGLLWRAKGEMQRAGVKNPLEREPPP